MSATTAPRGQRCRRNRAIVVTRSGSRTRASPRWRSPRGIGYGARSCSTSNTGLVRTLAGLERFIPFIRRSAWRCWRRCSDPNAARSNSTGLRRRHGVVPHIGSGTPRRSRLRQFPPLGDRSFAGGPHHRVRRVSPTPGSPSRTPARGAGRLSRTPGIEDVAEILALEAVDGVCRPARPVPARDRGAYSRQAGDFADLRKVADAGRPRRASHGCCPPVVRGEEFAARRGPSARVDHEHGALAAGFATPFEQMAH